MKIKLSVSLIAMTTVLYGCASAPSHQSAIVAPIKAAVITEPVKVVGDGSHLLGLSMTREFIMNSNGYPPEININYQQALVKVAEEISAQTRKTKNLPDKKIFSIKPVGNINPRAVILLKKGTIEPREWTVRKKNITLCEGFMTLPPATPNESTGSPPNRDNEVITFMPVNSTDTKNTPSSPKGCEKFISDKNGYDYGSALQELNFILDGKDIGRSPFLAIYESPTSPYSSMVLSLGELSPNTLRVMGNNWPELIANVYQHGTNVDPVAGIATMLLLDPKLQQAQRDATSEYLKIGVTGATCAGTLSATTISIASLLKISTCAKFVIDTADALGYTIPIHIREMLG